MSWLKKTLGNQSDLAIILMMLGILVVLFTPIPAWLLDFLLLANFSFALLILLLTFYMTKPLEFSTFPSLLLMATLFRLALNVAATRLILSDADAGQVIDTIGHYVISGNYVIGMIVFIVLVIVQYVVITNGAQRVAEVAARFTLDSMPGKQMSIDADMNMGLIDEVEAKERRKTIEQEANFYGAMDGSSRFVKGDAIAGILIVLIDIIGGLTIGIAQMGMDWGEALQTFTLLTIGDGIVTQVPALIIATSTGIIVTRAATDAVLSDEVSKQITAFPKALALVAVSLLAVSLMPGMPFWPVALLVIIVSLLTWTAFKLSLNKQSDTDQGIEETTDQSQDNIYNLMRVEPIEISVGQNLINMVGDDDSLFMERIVSFRKQYALDMGFVIPKVRVKDDKKLRPNGYEIRVFDTKVADNQILPDRILAINPNGEKLDIVGVEARDPTYNLAAVWVTEDLKSEAREKGYTLVEPTTVMLTHLNEVIKKHAPQLLSRSETEKIIEHVKERNNSLIEDLVPTVMSVGDLQKVLQNLLRENISIRNIEQIVEVTADASGRNKDIDYITAAVREGIGSAICQSLATEQGELHVLTLDPSIEQKINSSIRVVENKSAIVLEPAFAQQLIQKLLIEVEQMLEQNRTPILLCAPSLRGHIRTFTERLIPQLSVLSMSEVPNSFDLKSVGMVSL
ncbi:MAG TPA: flagellar biosynthesis protein FlhA [Tenacibaculum sp.]|nr:flagellar biosynthesis protein FlhA [Tenacibaculum sp.]